MPRLRCGAVAVALIVAAAVVGAGTSARAQEVLAVVNGTPITSYDVAQRTKLTVLSTHKSPSRKDILQELIDEHLKVNEAKKYSVEIKNSEVDQAFGTMASRMGMKAPQLAKALSDHGINVQTLKMRIRADLAWGQLVRGRFQSNLLITDPDIESAIKRDEKNRNEAVGYIYTLRPILFIVPPGAPPATIEARRRDAEALRGRFDNCTQGISVARSLRDVAVRQPIFRNSADLPAAFRTMLDGLEIGRLTKPDTTAQGVEMFALCAKKATRADTPQKEAARQEIFTKRFEAQSKEYLKEIRRQAMIEYKVGAK